MTHAAIRWGLAAAATLLAEATLIALSVACVALYSYAIHTGETPEFYAAFAQVSGPWVSLIAGAPVFYVIARWIRRRARTSAFGTVMAMLGLYLAIEIGVLAVWPGESSAAFLFLFGGFALKVAGAWLGVGGTAGRSLADTTT